MYNKRTRRFKKGGAIDDKKAMILSQIKEVHHHADELAKVLANMDTVDAWVVGKMERATTDLSDITHYLDGTTQYAKGGMMSNSKYNLSFNYNPSNLKNSEAEKIVSKYTKNWRRDNDLDEVSFFVMGLSLQKAKELQDELKMEDVYNIEIDNSRYADGGMMANPIEIMQQRMMDEGLVFKRLKTPEQYSKGVVEEIIESVELGYDTLVQGMIGKKRMGVMLINKDYEVRGVYDIGLKEEIQNLLEKIKQGQQYEEEIQNLLEKIKQGQQYADGGSISDMTYIGTLYDADDAMNAKKDLLKTGNFSHIRIQKTKFANQTAKYTRRNESYFMWRIYVDLADYVAEMPSKEYNKLSEEWSSIIQKNQTYKGRQKVYADGGVLIYKELDLNRRDGKKKVTQITSAENYREALKKIEELENKNKNPNVRYFTGNIYR